MVILSRPATCLFSALMLMFVALSPSWSAEPEPQTYPRHADLATLGTVLGMRGQQSAERGLPVYFASSDVAARLVETDFRYEGFFLHQILISKVATITGQPDSWRVQGLLVFEDMASRRAYAQYSTYYRVVNDGIEITRTVARAFTPTEPTIIWFALHQGDVPESMLEPESHAELIKLAATQSLRMVPANADDFVIFALSMDRFSPTEKFSLHAEGQSLEMSTVNLGGWPVGIFTGHLDPKEVAGRLSVNLVGDAFAGSVAVLPAFPLRPFEWDTNTD